MINLLTGFTNDRWLASEANPAGYHASMWIFTGIAVPAVVCATALWKAEAGPHAHGLETITAH